MTVILCPHCGASMNIPLKFCLSCGRAVSSTEIKKLGGMKVQMKAEITKRLSDSITSASFHRAKKSYRFQRGVRQFLLNVCYVLILVLLFYTMVKLVSKETMPGIHHKSVHKSTESKGKPSKTGSQQ